MARYDRAITVFLSRRPPLPGGVRPRSRPQGQRCRRRQRHRHHCPWRREEVHRQAPRLQYAVHRYEPEDDHIFHIYYDSVLMAPFDQHVITSSVRKIVNLDNHIALACAGLKADARVLINRARIECQSHRLTVEDPVTVEYIYSIHSWSSTETDPSGTFSAWKANATGRNSNSMREFLEKNYKETSGQETVKLAIRALLEVVESGGKNIEVAVMTKDHGLRQLDEAEIDAVVAEIEAEKAAAEAAKKGPPKET
ncbi:20S proteasome alpha subunit PAD1 [Actinidia rufa]|uniref:20S proteasome alpha subunit PAD1 n=1 Tax=Actinidia rufa TaxID=165716 RepID=A0A7J0E1Q1_9ERIC|nr:20S proteasome alpha subunit PAD1 [Actinidia rufa]